MTHDENTAYKSLTKIISPTKALQTHKSITYLMSTTVKTQVRQSYGCP